MIVLALVAAVGARADGVQPVFPSLVMWSVDLPAPPAASPVAAGPVIAVALRSGEVAAWTLADQRPAWSATLPASGPLSSAGDRIVLHAGGDLHALAASSGQGLWRTPLGPVTAPLLVRDGWILAGAADGLTAIRLSNGATVWSRPLGRVDRRPAIDGDRVYVALSEGRLLALDLESGSVIWERRLGASVTEPLAIGGRVYVGVGRAFTCLKAPSGAQDWTWEIGAPIVGAAAVDEAHVYMTAMDNLVRALDRISGNERWKADLGHRPESGPIVIGTTVIVAGRAAVIRGYDARTGRRASQLSLPDQMVVEPTFFMAPEGRQMVAAATANLRGENRLTLAGSATPFVPVVPLTSLPGSPLTAPAPEAKTPRP